VVVVRASVTQERGKARGAGGGGDAMEGRGEMELGERREREEPRNGRN
jgi:hypothetical protein